MQSLSRLVTRLRPLSQPYASRAFATETVKVTAPLPEDDPEGWKIQSYDPKDYGPNDVIDATMHGSLEWLISSPPELHLFDEPPTIYEAEPAKKA